VEESINLLADFAAGVLIGEIVLGVDSDSMDFIGTIPTGMSAILMSTTRIGVITSIVT
jgi:hypothetical protein